MNAIQIIQSQLAASEAFLVTSEPNRFYLTRFASSAGAVFVSKECAVFLIDFRYVEKAKKTVSTCSVRLSTNLNTEVDELCRESKIKTLYIETESVSVQAFEKWQSALSDTVVSSDGRMNELILDLRSVKSKEELHSIREAQRLTDETFSYILEKIEAGRTERDVMLEMEFFMRKLGSEGVSFDFIVVSGKNSSLPHGVPTDKLIERGDFLTMDFGAVVNGYHSDMTRTVAIGAVTEEQRVVYDTVLQAQLKAIGAVKAGAVCNNIDKIARDLIDAAGFKGCFGHGLGHSVGVEIHESPAFNPRCDAVLKAGTIMTVEPGIYLENRFGVRIEDMVYVTESSCINLTKSPKELIIL